MEGDLMYTIEYTPTEQNYIDYQVYNFETSKYSQRQVWIVALSMLLLCWISSFTVTVRLQGFRLADFLVIVVGGLVLFVILFLFLKYVSKLAVIRAARSLIKSGRTGSFFFPHTLGLENGCLHMKAESPYEQTQSVYSLTGVENLLEINNCIYLGFSTHTLIIPVSAFQSEQQKQDFTLAVQGKKQRSLRQSILYAATCCKHSILTAKCACKGQAPCTPQKTEPAKKL